jgi:hypothetical protein
MVSATKINKNTPFVGLINYKISRISKNRILPNLYGYILKTAAFLKSCRW